MRSQPVDDCVYKGYRRLLQWVDDAPLEYQTELRPRLAARNDITVEGAMFELVVLRLLQAIWGAQCFSAMSTSLHVNQPDFLLSRPDQHAIGVEATVLHPQRPERDASHHTWEFMRRVCARLRTRGWDIWTDGVELGKSVPSQVMLAREADDWLRALDHVAILSQAERLEHPERFWTLPVRKFEVADWVFRLRAVPHVGNREFAKAINGTGYGSTWDRVATVRNGLRSKLRQFDGRSEPLIVALCCNEWPGEPCTEDVASALYGDPRLGKRGLWHQSRTAQDRLTAVLQFSRCFPWTFPNEHITLWQSPLRPVNLDSWPFRVVEEREYGEVREIQPAPKASDVLSRFEGDADCALEPETHIEL